MNPMQSKTPEERRAIAAKGIETRRRRLREDADLLFVAKGRVVGLKDRIDELEARLLELQTIEVMACASAKLTGKTLLREEQIIASSLPWDAASGIYFLVKDKRVVYVGQSVNVFARIPTHRDKDFDSYAYIPCSRSTLNRLESLYIHLLQPPLNGSQSDGIKLAPMPLNAILGEAAARA